MDNGDNLIVNTTDTQEIQWVVNGKPQNQMIQINGYRCIDTCLDAVEEGEVSETQILWSNPDNWPNAQLP